MDFKRIEWIFFLVFLSLNIFLFTIYRQGVNEENSVSLTEQTESIEKRLVKDKIFYKGKLSSEKSEGYYLSAEQTNFDSLIGQEESGFLYPLRTKNTAGTTLTVYPQINSDTTNYYIDKNDIKQSVEAFLQGEEMVIYGKQYEYIPNFSTLNVEFPELLVFQKYKNIPIKDDTAQISLKLDQSENQSDLYKINKYIQAHIQEIGELRDKMDLYSEKDAVETLYMNNKILSNSEITFRTLAYSRIYKIREKNVYVPVWFIGIQSTENSVQIEQVNAMNNTIITNTTVPKVENH